MISLNHAALLDSHKPKKHLAKIREPYCQFLPRRPLRRDFPDQLGSAKGAQAL